LKKAIPYIILMLVIAAVVVLLFTGDNSGKQQPRVMDERITLRKDDKIPYGASLAFAHLKYIFPAATISVNQKEPGYWDSLSNYGAGQALFILTPQFYADRYEMKKLLNFVENGNDVFISTRYISAAAENFINNRSEVANTSLSVDNSGDKYMDSVYFHLKQPEFEEKRNFGYRGWAYNAQFYDVDATTSDVLGTDNKDRVNFIRLRAGKGNLYVHLAPIAFSNYFLLQGDNMSYYENVMSLISPDTKTIVWDEYYSNRKNAYPQPRDDSKDDDQGFFAEMFRYKQAKWALLLAGFLLLLYVLLEMRRKQRAIPVMARPKNESLDFVKTIGRLYHEKADHRNLCRKMASYFMEHVRNKYKLATGTLDEEFVKKLQFKTGCEEKEIEGITSFIKTIETRAVTDKDVIDFHKRLEEFYKKA
jgi:hypothetical protein